MHGHMVSTLVKLVCHVQTVLAGEQLEVIRTEVTLFTLEATQSPRHMWSISLKHTN